jgi:hypothetical protein
MVLDVVVSSRSAVWVGDDDGVNRKYLNCILKLNVHRVVTLENIYLMRNGSRQYGAQSSSS